MIYELVWGKEILIAKETKFHVIFKSARIKNYQNMAEKDENSSVLGRWSHFERLSGGVSQEPRVSTMLKGGFQEKKS